MNLERFFAMLEGGRKSPASEWMTVEEVARELRISKSIVYRITRSGDVAAVDTVDSNEHIAKKGHYRIKRSSLDQYLELKPLKPLQNPTRGLRPTHCSKVKNHLGL